MCPEATLDESSSLLYLAGLQQKQYHSHYRTNIVGLYYYNINVLCQYSGRILLQHGIILVYSGKSQIKPINKFCNANKRVAFSRMMAS